MLRVAVQGGGCSGFEYALGFDRGPQEGDARARYARRPRRRRSVQRALPEGHDIDFLDGLQESGFKIENPNVTASCGCGHSFQVDDETPAESVGGCGSGCSH